jgi:hypothetical protein
MERTNSQNRKVLRWMKKRGSITPQDALTFGCMRLAARIKDLRDGGTDIITDTMEYTDTDGKTTRFASYRLREMT